MDASEKLKAYSLELDLMDGMTIDSLIDSHRRLREENAKRWQERRDEMTKAREWAANQAREYVLTQEYVSVERLRGMTLIEIAELIRED